MGTNFTTRSASSSQVNLKTVSLSASIVKCPAKRHPRLQTSFAVRLEVGLDVGLIGLEVGLGIGLDVGLGIGLHAGLQVGLERGSEAGG